MSSIDRPAPPSGGAADQGAPVVDIIVNGQPRVVAVGTTIAGLIGELGLAGRPVAVERNREVVPKAQHASTILAAGDQLEVVTFVGGG